MAKTVTIDMNVNTKMVQIALCIMGIMWRMGVPKIMAARIAMPLAWVRVWHSGQPFWRGWAWIGGNVDIHNV